MLATLLFIAIIISCKTFTKGFTKLPHISIKTKLNVRLINTHFYEDEDDEDENDKKDKKRTYNYEYDSNFNNHIQEEDLIMQNNGNLDDNEVFYTLIWYDCEDCLNLLKDIKKDRNQMLYINGGHYFFDENDETNTPLFYKNDELIATDIFSIYEELFFKNINEE